MAKDIHGIRNHFTKKKSILIIVVGILVLVAGFTVFSNHQTAADSVVLKNVAVQKILAESYETSIDYLGIVKPYETKNYSFLQGGRIEKIYVEKGQKIKPGDILATLDAASLQLSQSTASQNVQILENSVRLAKSNLDASKTLFQEGALAAKTLEAQQTEYLNLVASYEMAKNSLGQATEGLSNATLYSDMEGYVMELPFKAGEIAGAGYPVVVGKSDGVKVTIGVSVGDYEKISKGSTVLINGSIKGTIDTISAFPDETTMVYAVDIAFDSNAVAIGETVDVQIMTGKGEGCFVPIGSVFNLDGIDYVYTVSNDKKGNHKVNKQQVMIHEISGSNIRVTGLKAGTLVVTAGIKSLKENDTVNIVKTEGAAD